MKHRHIDNDGWIKLHKEMISILSDKVKNKETNSTMLCDSDIESITIAVLTDRLIYGDGRSALYGLNLAYFKGYKDAMADAQEALVKVDEKLEKDKKDA